MAERWTEADIPDQTGRVALITGANSGIGYESARALAEHGGRVLLACRNAAKADEAIERIRPLAPAGTVEFVELDLSDLESVASAAQQVRSSTDRIDLLVNNAGLMATPQQRTAQGFEMQFGVNHLGHFALTGLLIEALLATPGSRIVNISSQGHRPGKIAFDDLNWNTRKYSPWPAYFQSKLANLLFTRELQRRFNGSGAETIAVAAHPGSSATNLGHENPGGMLNSVAFKLRPFYESLFTQNQAMGALPTLRAATDPAARGGDYYGPDGFGEQKGFPVLVDMSSRAKDPASARRLWDISEELTGVSYLSPSL